jgi:hypothetical protein
VLGTNSKTDVGYASVLRAGRIKKLSQEGNHVIAWFLLKFSMPTHALLLYRSLNFPLKNDASAARTAAKVFLVKSCGGIFLGNRI